jgi:hypothetical protein
MKDFAFIVNRMVFGMIISRKGLGSLMHAEAPPMGRETQLRCYYSAVQTRSIRSKERKKTNHMKKVPPFRGQRG